MSSIAFALTNAQIAGKPVNCLLINAGLDD
jgi:hypothetical protein